MKRRSAQELVKHYPGVVTRRREIILALCRNCNLTGDNWQTYTIGKRIVELANTIIEETEQ